MGTSPGPPRPPSPWLLLPLLVVAGTTNPSPRQVNGALGGSVLLSPLLLPNKTVEIEWSFSGGARVTMRVAEFGPGGFKRPNPKDRFKDRLEMLNQTGGLRIQRLELGDSGVYEARIKLDPGLFEDQFFNLSVYGPLRDLEIQHQLLSYSTHGCNLTLWCWVPADSRAEATWEPRPPWGHLCGDKQTLCLAVPPSAFNSTVTCLARNPMEERNISIRLDTLCQQKEAHGWEGWHWCLVAVAVGALLGGFWLWRKKRKRRRKKRAEEGRAPPQPHHHLQRGAGKSGQGGRGAGVAPPPSPN